MHLVIGFRPGAPPTRLRMTTRWRHLFLLNTPTWHLPGRDNGASLCVYFSVHLERRMRSLVALGRMTGREKYVFLCVRDCQDEVKSFGFIRVSACLCLRRLGLGFGVILYSMLLLLGSGNTVFITFIFS